MAIVDFFLAIIVVFLGWCIYIIFPKRDSAILVSTETEEIHPFVASYPKEFLESQFPRNKTQQRYKDRYIGTFMNAGVIYDKEFIETHQNTQTFREPAAYTPYAQDYIHYVERPEAKPFPSY